MTIPFARVVGGAVVAESGGATPVPWWSFGKTVIAAAALALVRDGRLALDQGLPGRPYTLRQLLGHRAGLPDYGALPAYQAAVAAGDAPWTAPELLARVEAERPRYPPGEGWDYSNVGYMIVAGLVEEAGGAALGPALERLVLGPLGVRARLAQTPADLAGVEMGTAVGYHPGFVHHGLLVGPLTEAALLLDRLMGGPFLPTELLAAMRRAHPLGGPVPGRPWRAPGYGLGLMRGAATDGGTVEGHTGGGPGSAVAVYRRPDATPPSTTAAFSPGDDPAPVETLAFGP